MTRQKRTEDFLNEALADPLRELLLAQHREPFATLHSLADTGGLSS